MKLTNEALASAVQAGLALTDPESDLLQVYRKHAGGLMVLRNVLNGIGTGQLAIKAVEQETPPKEPPSGDAGKASKKTPRKKTPRKKTPTKK